MAMNEIRSSSQNVASRTESNVDSGVILEVGTLSTLISSENNVCETRRGMISFSPVGECDSVRSRSSENGRTDNRVAMEGSVPSVNSRTESTRSGYTEVRSLFERTTLQNSLIVSQEEALNNSAANSTRSPSLRMTTDGRHTVGAGESSANASTNLTFIPD